MVLRTGFEPAIFAVRGRCPKPLDDRSKRSRMIPHGWVISSVEGKVAVGQNLMISVIDRVQIAD